MTKFSPCLLLLPLAFTACFGSSNPPPACDSPCGADAVPTEFCDLRDANCTTALDCRGEPQFCVMPLCDEPRPVCDGVEVVSCEGRESCRELSYCDNTVYCAAPEACMPRPACEDNEVLSDLSCADASRSARRCRDERACDGTAFSCFQERGPCPLPELMCSPGTVRVDFCQRGEDGCEVVEGCGQALFCLPVDICDAEPICPPGTRDVGFCDHLREPNCERYEVCGVERYCQRQDVCVGRVPAPAGCAPGDEESLAPCGARERELGLCYESVGPCGPVYCRVECVSPAPTCFGDEEPSFFEPCAPGESGCRTLIGECGDEIYCRRADCFEPGGFTCEPGEEISFDERCGIGEPDCRSEESCGTEYFCRPARVCEDIDIDPCGAATSEVLESGPGTCEGLPNCIETSYCDEPWVCLTACPRGAEQVGGPLDCASPRDCYESVPPFFPAPTAWCMGGDEPTCDAEPACNPGDVEIDFYTVCPPDGRCYHTSACGSAIQCRQLPTP
ncbi:MAG: hypothetical protein AAF411_05725 [Myxococcota bacterium]